VRGAGDGQEIRASLTVGLTADCYRPTASGVVTAIVQLARALERRGHRAIVLTVDTPPNRAREPGVYRFPSLPFSKASGFRLGLATPGAVGRILRREGVGVVHTHTEFGLGWAARRAAQALDLPLVHTAHTLYEHYRHYLFGGRLLPRWGIQAYLKLFLRGYDALVCPSPKAQAYYGPLAPQARTAIIGNGISSNWVRSERWTGPEREMARKRLGIEPGEGAILYVGRMGPEKRVRQLLTALLPLLQEQKGVKVLLVGCGPLYRPLVEAAAGSGAGQQILFTGAVPWERMRELYLAADLFASASLSEVHPMTLVEANACGLPAVVRRDDAYHGLVEDGYNGYLADSEEELAEIAAALLPDADELRRLSRNARRLAEDLTIEACVNRLEALYQQLLRPRGPEGA
jgi:1,2-diacylglycerol 3-alpha-glucosyltransferase